MPPLYLPVSTDSVQNPASLVSSCHVSLLSPHVKSQWSERSANLGAQRASFFPSGFAGSSWQIGQDVPLSLLLVQSTWPACRTSGEMQSGHGPEKREDALVSSFETHS